jgi:hypothetical protein
MAFIQSIETARADRVGAEGVAAAAFDDAPARSGAAPDWQRTRHADGGLPLPRLPAARDQPAVEEGKVLAKRYLAGNR